MRSLSAPEYPLIALIVLSLAGKLATNTAEQPSANTQRSFASAVVQQFSQGGFKTAVRHWPSGVVVYAQRGACRMWVRDSKPHGTYRNVYEDLAKPFGSLRYIYMGTAAEEPPQLDPLLRFYFHREMLRLGVPTRRYPIYAVAASAACAHSSITWPASIT